VFSVELELAGIADQHTAELVAEQLIHSTARWFVAAKRRGEDPPCCVSCAELRHEAAAPRIRSKKRAGPALLRHGSGSCDELCGYDAGVARAKMVLAGWPYSEAVRAIRPKAGARKAPDGSEAPYYHCVYIEHGETKDPVVKLRKKGLA